MSRSRHIYLILKVQLFHIFFTLNLVSVNGQGMDHVKLRLNACPHSTSVAPAKNRRICQKKAIILFFGTNIFINSLLELIMVKHFAKIIRAAENKIFNFVSCNCNKLRFFPLCNTHNMIYKQHREISTSFVPKFFQKCD